MELKTLHQHRPSNKPVAEVEKVVTPTSSIQVKAKISKRELETSKTTSSDPSLRRVSTRKKKKEPTLEPSMEEEEEGSSKDMEEVEMVNSNEESESEEEEEPELEIPLPEKTKIKIQTLERKKSTLAFKTLVSIKRPAKEKTLKKGENSQNKSKRK